jgi:hypothetical protein
LTRREGSSWVRGSSHAIAVTELHRLAIERGMSRGVGVGDLR